jgi:hypothetical protein
MNILSRDEVADLIVSGNGDEVCLSLFMPMQRGPDKRQENHIRLKNLYKTIETKLTDRDIPSVHGKQFLDSVETFLVNGRLPSNSDGMALFSKKDDTQVHFFPHSFAEQVMIDNQFFIKPLLPLLAEDGNFYILALSQNEVQLYRANQEEIETITPTDLPQSLAEALKFDDPEKQQQLHTSTDSPLAPGDQPVAFHTHHPDDQKKSQLRRFFQQVEKSVSAQLAPEDIPLVLAGVDYLLPIYREVNSYSHLLAGEIKGNPERLAEHDLRAQAWEIVRPHFSQASQAALEEFNTLKGSEKVSTDLKEIVAAAHYGRIDTLFAAEDQERWGTFDEQTGQVHQGDSKSKQHELTNLASRHTLLNSGTAYVLPGTAMPEGAPLAAIFRYATSA